MKPKTKVCKRCGKRKPLSEFFRSSSSKDGLYYYCRECCKEYSREHYRRDKQYQDRAKARSSMQYYLTDYLIKRYIKRHEKSLAFAEEKMKALMEKKERQGGRLNTNDQLKEQRYPIAIKEWQEKIANLKAQLESYNDIRHGLPPKQQPTQQPVKEKGIMTKEKLIELLSSVPAGAQVIHVSDTENQSSLVAVWANESGDTIIRRMVDKMPYICAEGNLFNLVSGGLTKSKEE